MAKGVDIRPLRREDEVEWRRLWTDYLTFYETKLPEDVYRSTFERLLSGGEGEFRALVAVADGRTVGLTHYLLHRSNWSIDNICYLQDLYADPDVRGRGIGRALIEAVYINARNEGAAKVYWMTQEFNDTARALYDRLAVKSPFVVYQNPL